MDRERGRTESATPAGQPGQLGQNAPTASAGQPEQPGQLGRPEQAEQPGRPGREKPIGQADLAGVAEPSGGASAPKRPRKKWPIAVGVAVAVLVAAGAGFWVWHEQPSFCNAVCHEPMDAYVEGYYNDSSQMAYTHRAVGTTCLQCHEPKLDEQIGEALVWLRGDFAMAADGKLATVGVRSDAKMCTGAGCHEFDEVVAATENWGGETGVNPHDSHQGYALDCSSCHTAHGQSFMYCNTCHDYEVPKGWAAPVRSEPAGDVA